MREITNTTFFNKVAFSRIKNKIKLESSLLNHLKIDNFTTQNGVLYTDFPLTRDHHDKVVGVADQSVVRRAMTATFLTLLNRVHRLLPRAHEVIIQHGQRDVGQQRRQDPSAAKFPILFYFLSLKMLLY